jgi:hypothetical protein
MENPLHLVSHWMLHARPTTFYTESEGKRLIPTTLRAPSKKYSQKDSALSASSEAK